MTKTIKTATLPGACVYEEYWTDTKHVKQLRNNKSRVSEIF